MSSEALSSSDRTQVLLGCLVVIFALVGLLLGTFMGKPNQAPGPGSAFLDAVLENLPAMVFMKEAPELRFSRFNKAGEELLGLTREKLLGKNDFDFFPAEQARFFVEKDRETLAGGSVVDIPEESIQTATGTRWLHTRKVPLAGPGGPGQYLLGVSLDITDTREAKMELARSNEALRRAKDSAELASRELEAFSYSVSHDLRAPLRAVSGWAEALAEDCGPALGDAGKAHLRRIQAGAARMSGLIDDLLALSRINRTELKVLAVDLSVLAEEVVNDLKEASPARKVVVKIEQGMRAAADEKLMRVVMANLIGNAWKFTSRNEAALIEVGYSGSGSTAEYFVRDDGAGFDMTFASKLFGAFQRLHSESEFEGTGVGLATVQRVIHRHGGTIRAESTLGKGALFAFTLPGPVREPTPAP